MMCFTESLVDKKSQGFSPIKLAYKGDYTQIETDAKQMLYIFYFRSKSQKNLQIRP